MPFVVTCNTQPAPITSARLPTVWNNSSDCAVSQFNVLARGGDEVHMATRSRKGYWRMSANSIHYRPKARV
jgi:hypothetical protein